MKFIKKMALCYCFHSLSSKDQFLNLLNFCKEIYYLNNDVDVPELIPLLIPKNHLDLPTRHAPIERYPINIYILYPRIAESQWCSFMNMPFFIKVSHRKLIWTNPILKITYWRV